MISDVNICDALAAATLEPPVLPIELQCQILVRGFGAGCRTFSKEMRSEHDATLRSLAIAAAAPASTIRVMVQRCPRLVSISLRHSEIADDELLSYVLAVLPELTTIDVSFCSQLTAARSLGALRDFRSLRGGEWTASGTFWAPSPLLTPEIVVTNQERAFWFAPSVSARIPYVSVRSPELAPFLLRACALLAGPRSPPE